MAPFDKLHTSSYSSSIVIMAVSCTVFEIMRNIGRKRQFFTPFVFNLHDPSELRSFVKILMQTELLGGAKILLKRVQQRYNDRRQTDR